MGLMLITHDLGVVADVADRIVVMYAGQIVERAEVGDLYRNPAHPYTEGLLNSIPRVDQKGQELYAIKGLPPEPAADAQRLPVPSPVPPGPGHLQERPPGAARGRSATVEPLPLRRGGARWLRSSSRPKGSRSTTRSARASCAGRWATSRPWTVSPSTCTPGRLSASSGESGCGKSTLGRLLMRLEEPTEGSLHFDGGDMYAWNKKDMRRVRRDIQIVFQDPYTSLNPRRTVGDIVGEPFEIHPDVVPKGDRKRRVQELLELVGLAPEHINRYPHQFSGGQRQRIGIARGIALEPQGAHLRRAGLGAGRVRPGAGDQRDGTAQA